MCLSAAKSAPGPAWKPTAPSASAMPTSRRGIVRTPRAAPVARSTRQNSRWRVRSARRGRRPDGRALAVGELAEDPHRAERGRGGEAEDDAGGGHASILPPRNSSDDSDFFSDDESVALLLNARSPPTASPPRARRARNDRRGGGRAAVHPVGRVPAARGARANRWARRSSSASWHGGVRLTDAGARPRRSCGGAPRTGRALAESALAAASGDGRRPGADRLVPVRGVPPRGAGDADRWRARLRTCGASSSRRSWSRRCLPFRSARSTSYSGTSGSTSRFRGRSASTGPICSSTPSSSSCPALGHTPRRGDTRARGQLSGRARGRPADDRAPGDAVGLGGTHRSVRVASSAGSSRTSATGRTTASRASPSSPRARRSRCSRGSCARTPGRGVAMRALADGLVHRTTSRRRGSRTRSDRRSGPSCPRSAPPRHASITTDRLTSFRCRCSRRSTGWPARLRRDAPDHPVEYLHQRARRPSSRSPTSMPAIGLLLISQFHSS